MKPIATSMDEQVAEWVCEHISDLDLTDAEYTAIGQLNHGGSIIGGAVFTRFTQRDIHIHCAGIGKHWMTRRFLGEVYRYVFLGLACRRTTVMIRRSNEQSIRFVTSLGYQYEGVLRAYMPDNEDCLIFGMLREECRWLTVGVIKNGNRSQPHATAELRQRDAAAGRPPRNADGRRVIPASRRTH